LQHLTQQLPSFYFIFTVGPPIFFQRQLKAMLHKHNSIWGATDLIDRIIDDVEVKNVVNRFAKQYSEVKHDLLQGWNEGPLEKLDPILRGGKLQYFGQSRRKCDSDGYVPSPLEQQKREEIRSLEYSLRSSSENDFLRRLNRAIRSLPAEEFLQYCHDRPELKELTLEKELTRMRYVLFAPNGDKLTDPQQIAGFIRSDGDGSKNEVLYRASNQAIFADAITKLTSFHGLVRPQLSSGTFVDDSSLILDLSSDESHLRAECFLNVSIPDGRDDQLRLAGALIEVCLCPTRQEFSAKVLHLSPCHDLSDQQVKDAARSMAELASV